ncbi:hypothetical protein [Paracoccus sp. IB05]|uniref:hypothetical protein n=1 Tax=Paracoccus sp. IB05 TaxID=2779367 RepID=UPI0018E87728|nr:hypothetical protein [Paracoccus sp. IB05]MBJ2153875.1 hypothetical protein [Paracoccus sp. IB05]
MTINPKIFDLFLIFSQFERALIKTNDFIRRWPNDQSGRPAFADWNKLSRLLGEAFWIGLRQDDATRKLWEEPPGQWVIGENWRPDWKMRGADEAINGEAWHERGLEPAKWVRDCVFHGHSQDMIPRYKDLIEASITVLSKVVDECAQSDNPELKQFWENFASVYLQPEI